MKGVSYITDGLNRKKAVVIDLATLERYPGRVEDLLDVLVAESRKDEPKLDWEAVKQGLTTKSRS